MASLPKASQLAKAHSQRALFGSAPLQDSSPSAPSTGQYLPQFLGVDALACRDDAQVTNPAATSPNSPPARRPPTWLTADELRRLHWWLSSDEQSVECDLPDLVPFLGLRGLDERGTWTILAKRRGPHKKPSPKSAAGQRILELPPCEHAVALPVGMSLAARFSSELLAGGLRDPSNTLEMCQALLP
jgi:hypothetical protein